MNLTDAHKLMLKTMKRIPRANRFILTDKLYPGLIGHERAPAVARIGRALHELELGGYIECTNPDTQSWDLTDTGLEFVETLQNNE